MIVLLSIIKRIEGYFVNVLKTTMKMSDTLLMTLNTTMKMPISKILRMMLQLVINYFMSPCYMNNFLNNVGICSCNQYH